jgi:hypothetical protein
MHVLPENFKRAASTSPVLGDPNHNAKRIRLAKDIWSDEEHRQLDNVITQRLSGKHGKARKYDVNLELCMAMVLKCVGEAAWEGKQSNLFHAPAALEYYNAELEEDPDLLKVVGDSYTSGSYKSVLCLGEPFLHN